MLNWIGIIKQYLKPFNCAQTNELWIIKNITYKLFIYKSYIFDV